MKLLVFVFFSLLLASFTFSKPNVNACPAKDACSINIADHIDPILNAIIAGDRNVGIVDHIESVVIQYGFDPDGNWISTRTEYDDGSDCIIIYGPGGYQFVNCGGS